MLRGLAPVADANTRVLILGSFPSEASLAAQQYYAHPRNQFWRILGAVLREDLYLLEYENRCGMILRAGIGIWDVYAGCRRQGSLDSAIEDARLNDFAGLLARCPRIEAVLHNGGESARNRRHLQALGLQVRVLPSTSPANASWSFERKLGVWHAALAPFVSG
jgi:hypoxanthine-DNA glycosylase